MAGLLLRGWGSRAKRESQPSIAMSSHPVEAPPPWRRACPPTSQREETDEWTLISADSSGSTAVNCIKFLELSSLCVCSVASVGSTLCDPVDDGPPGSSVCGTLQARILEWVSTPSPRGSSRPRDPTRVPVSPHWWRVVYHQRPLGSPSAKARGLMPRVSGQFCEGQGHGWSQVVGLHCGMIVDHLIWITTAKIMRLWLNLPSVRCPHWIHKQLSVHF